MCVSLFYFIFQCEKYGKGIIDGSACSSMCEKETLYLGKCFTAKPSNQVGLFKRVSLFRCPQFASSRSSDLSCSLQVYSGNWGDLQGVIKCQMEEAPHFELGGKMEARKEAAAFNKPTKGTSVEKFREMIINHLKVREAHHQV